MMDPRKSMNVYPRPLGAYSKQTSLNFDMMRAKIFDDRTSSYSEGLNLWIAHFLTGVTTGVFTFIIASLEDYIVNFRMITTQ